jgi:hypothetical protein
VPLQLPLHYFIMNLKEIILPVCVFDLGSQVFLRIRELLAKVFAPLSLLLRRRLMNLYSYLICVRPSPSLCSWSSPSSETALFSQSIATICPWYTLGGLLCLTDGALMYTVDTEASVARVSATLPSSGSATVFYTSFLLRSASYPRLTTHRHSCRLYHLPTGLWRHYCFSYCKLRLS